MCTRVHGFDVFVRGHVVFFCNTHIHTNTPRTYAHTNKYTHIHTQICPHGYRFLSHTHTQMHTNTHTHTQHVPHTRTHTHTHTHTLSLSLSLSLALSLCLSPFQDSRLTDIEKSKESTGRVVAWRELGIHHR